MTLLLPSAALTLDEIACALGRPAHARRALVDAARYLESLKGDIGRELSGRLEENERRIRGRLDEIGLQVG